MLERLFRLRPGRGRYADLESRRLATRARWSKRLRRVTSPKNRIKSDIAV